MIANAKFAWEAILCLLVFNKRHPIRTGRVTVTFSFMSRNTSHRLPFTAISKQCQIMTKFMNFLCASENCSRIEWTKAFWMGNLGEQTTFGD